MGPGATSPKDATDGVPDLPDGERSPRWLVVAASVGLRLLVLGVLVWLVAELATKVTLLLVALLVGLLLAGVFAPAVRWAARKGVPRGVSAVGGVLVVLAAVAGAVIGVSERVEEQLPELRDQVEAAAQQLSDTLGVEIPLIGPGDSEGDSGSGDPASGEGGTTGAGEGSSSSGPSVLGNVLSSVRTAFDVLIGFFLTLAFMFLFLTNGAAMWGWVLEKFGGTLRDDIDAAGNAAWRTVGTYVRSLSIVAAFDAVAIGVGLLLLRVPLALTLALLQFVASYIPTIGALVAGAVAVAVAYASGGGTTALLTLVLIVVVQQVGNDVIEPYVMGRELPINALVVLAAVTAGGLLWGIAGALLFVPLTAAVTAAAHEVWVRHGRRPIAGGPSGTPPA